MSTIRPRISVIIPVFEQWDLLEACLAALQEQDFPADQFEVIVVNNEARADIELAVHEPLNLRLVHETVPGSYAARNCGIEHALGDVLAFTDADCIPAPGWLKAITGTLADETIARVGGPVVDRLPADVDPIIAEYQHVLSYNTEAWSQHGWAITGNMAAKRSVFDDIGMFDGSMKSGGDRFWGMRAQEAGYAIAYSKGMEIKHTARVDTEEILTRIRRIVHGDFDVLERNNDKAGMEKSLRRLKGRAWRPPLKFLSSKHLSTPLGVWDRVRYIGFRWRIRREMLSAAQNFFAGGQAERR